MNHYDDDGNGQMTADEFTLFIQDLGIEVDEAAEDDEEVATQLVSDRSTPAPEEPSQRDEVCEVAAAAALPLNLEHPEVGKILAPLADADGSVLASDLRRT